MPAWDKRECFFSFGFSTIKKVETNCRLCKNPVKFIVLFTELTH